jgi:hypothetical protein
MQPKRQIVFEKTTYKSIADRLRIHAKWLKYRYVDELQKYKAHRIMKFIGGCPTTKMTKFIADMKRMYETAPR